jgi:hypothetical protein
MHSIARSVLLGLAVAALAGCSTTSPAPPAGVAAPKAVKAAIECSLRAAGATYQGTCDVSCSVNALAINFDGIESKRACTGPARSVSVELARTAVAGKWLGAMQGVKPEDPTRFEVVANTAGSSSTGRTPFGWFVVTDMMESDSALQIRMDASRQVRPTTSDIAIIARTIELLPNAGVWNKNDNRECPPGQAKLSMFCALMQATTEVSGGIHYRQPALQAVREVLNTVDASRIKTHRIMDYNNHPDTTLPEIHALLRSALAKVEKDMR